MSKAGPVENNANLMLTRRVRGREFLLRPCTKLNQLIRYVTAVVASKWSIDLHAITVLSDHWHLCVADPLGNIVRFQRDCHSFIARALNTQWNGVEAVWSSRSPSRVRCEQPEDMVDKIAYTMANPVDAGLVRHGKSWPGVRHAWPCKPIAVSRPTYFFVGEEDGGVWPSKATLEFTRPHGYDKLSDLELGEVITNAISQREADIHAKNHEEGKGYLGRRAVLKQSRHRKAASPETPFGISPKVACKDPKLRIARLKYLQQWARDYTDALTKWRAGDRDAEFPTDTYQMAIRHNVRRRPAD